jgi:hypothetical protein
MKKIEIGAIIVCPTDLKAVRPNPEGEATILTLPKGVNGEIVSIVEEYLTILWEAPYKGSALGGYDLFYEPLLLKCDRDKVREWKNALSYMSSLAEIA